MSRLGMVPISYNPMCACKRFWNTMEMPARIFDQNFGHHLTEDELSHHHPILTPAGYLPRGMETHPETGVSEVQSTDDQFKVRLDVAQFTPDELTIHAEDKMVVVEGKHDEKLDHHGYVSRHFVRKYPIPENVMPDDVTANLSSDGVLTVLAPRRKPVTEEKARKVSIYLTGKPAVPQISANKDKETKSDK